MGRRPDPKPRKVTVVRYETPDGRRAAKATPGARKVKTTSDSYYAELPSRRAGKKKDRIPLGTTDLAVAWVNLRQILDDRHKEALGILDDRSKQAARPIADHVDEWLAAVAAGGASAKHVDQLRSRITLLIATAKWRHVGEIKKSSCQTALAALQREAGRGRGSAGRGKGVSAETRNHYLRHARQFSAWLLDEGRLAVDPLAGLKGVSVASDRRHDRRVPDEAEIRVFFDHLDGAQRGCLPKIRRKMTGPHRAIGYQVAMCAGLRAGELRRLTRENFDLATGDVRVTGKSDKAKKRRLMALPRWLLDKLAAWFADGGKTWENFPAQDPGDLLRADLARARQGWVNEAAGDLAELRRREDSTTCVYETVGEEGPLYWDFHSLRHWYITQVAATDGISPSTLQALSRHSDPHLTLNTYAKAKRDGVRHAVDQLPNLDGPSPVVAPLVAPNDDRT